MFSVMHDALTNRRKGTVITLNEGVDQWIDVAPLCIPANLSHCSGGGRHDP